MKGIGMKRRIGRAPRIKSLAPKAMKMESPRKMMAEGMNVSMKPPSMKGPKMGGPMAPAIPGFKKGGKVNKGTWGSTEDIMGTGPTPAAAKADYAKKMKAAGLKPKMAKGGMAKKPKMGIGIMIVLGKKKGK